MTERKRMTTAARTPMADNHNSITAGVRGPDLVADNQPDSR